ncbi:MAG TPA: nickel pincer cofactor biosynthesis protein LarC [bacterium]|nr:nickel pincer cofactor biosynthesis protein LarC [bacterium]
MRIGYLDCASGASGDMLLGALLGAGWPEAALQEVVSALGVPVRVTVSRTERRGVPAMRVEVAEDDPPHARAYPRLQELLAGSRVEVSVRARAGAVLRRLAEVESQVHGVPLEQVHLHELGGLDTLVDVVGVLAGVTALNIGRVVASPVNVGRGWVPIQHGVVPVPAPATQVFLEGMPVYAGEVEGELLTPTGAALLRAVVAEWGVLPPMRVERIGTGAGRADPARANVLRLFVGEALDAPRENDLPAVTQVAAPLGAERLVVLETSIDDMNPQVYPHVTARLFEAGALDVAILPAVMKKGRPGQVLRVLTAPEQARAICGILFAETTTLGVRTHDVTRLALRRRTVDVETEYGPVPVKVASDDDGVLNVAPEFEACRTLAQQHGVPLKRVLAAAQRASATLLVPASLHRRDAHTSI